MELLRAGPPHNQLLSPLTQYLGICGASGAGIVTLRYEHGPFLRRLKLMRYDGGETSERFALLREIGVEMARILGTVPGLAGGLSGDAAGVATLVHLRLVLSASELALLPFELSMVPTGTESVTETWLALQTQVPTCITRRARNVPVEATNWPAVPRVLFVAADPGDIPFQEHRDVLLEVTAPYRMPGRDDPKVSEAGRRAQYGGVLTIWKGAKFDDIAKECAENQYTHVHILAHGVPDPDAEDLSYGLALPGPEQVVSGERMATAFCNLASGTVHRPTVVTIASCDSGNVGSVIVGGASFAHLLHQNGIPLVTASQFPLSKDGSVAVARTLYGGFLRGENPWVLFHKVRTELAGRFATQAHDWASLVVYEALPENLTEELEKTRYEQGRRALSVALERLDRAVVKEGAALSAEQRALLIAAVAKASSALPLEGALRLESQGICGSAWKRVAEAEHRIASSAATGSQEQNDALRREFEFLDRSLANYRAALQGFLVHDGRPVHRIAALHWVLVQSISVATVTGKHSPEGSWQAAKLSADAYLEHADLEQRAWAHGSLAELYLLRLADPLAGPDDLQNAASFARTHVTELVKLFSSRDAFPIVSTRLQFERYTQWWGSAHFEEGLASFGSDERPSWHDDGGVVMTAKELIDILDHRRGPSETRPFAAKIRHTQVQPEQIASAALKAKAGNKSVTMKPATKRPSAPAAVKGTALNSAGKSSTGLTSGPFLNIEMLPAGHGDCLWIEYGDGARRSRLLVDCGTESTYKPLKARVEKVPANERHLELFMLSHIDADHIGGAIPFFKDTTLDLTFDDVWFNAYKHISGFLSAKHAEIFSTLITDRKLPWNKWTGGKTIVVDSTVLPTCTLPGGMVLTLLSPTPATLIKLQRQWLKEIAKIGLRPGESEDFRKFLAITQTTSEDIDELADSKFSSDTAAPNGSSIAVLAEYGGKSVILGADAHAPVMVDSIKKLLKQRGLAKLCVDAFKVSHHASQNNLNVELMKLMDCPRYLISSNGSHFNHPDRQAIARCIKYGGENPQVFFNFKTKFNDVWAKPELQEKYHYAAVFPQEGEAGLLVAL